MMNHTVDIIRQRESENDGQTIHLYYNEMTGLYQGFGQSAYYTTAVLDPFVSYSEEMELPVVMLNKSDILKLRQSMQIIEHEHKCYYHFQTRNKIGTRWYKVWTDSIK